jgi:hypothetical protein
LFLRAYQAAPIVFIVRSCLPMVTFRLVALSRHMVRSDSDHRRNIMAEAKPPMGLDPNMGAREFVLEVDAEALEKMRKVGHVKIPLLGESFTIACDEGDAVGGDNTAPPPLAYFCASIAF